MLTNFEGHIKQQKFYQLWKCQLCTLLNIHFIIETNLHGIVSPRSLRDVAQHHCFSMLLAIIWYIFGYLAHWGQPLHQVWYWSSEGVKRYWAENIVGWEECFNLDLWPCDPKINRNHLLIKGNPWTKFGIDQVNGSKDIERTTLVYRPADRPTVAKQYAPFFKGGIKIHWILWTPLASAGSKVVPSITVTITLHIWFFCKLYQQMLYFTSKTFVVWGIKLDIIKVRGRLENLLWAFFAHVFVTCKPALDKCISYTIHIRINSWNDHLPLYAYPVI